MSSLMYRWRNYHYQHYCSITLAWILYLLCIAGPCLAEVMQDTTEWHTRKLRPTSCALNRSIQGYSNLESLRQDLIRIKDDTVLSLCPNVTWNMDNSDPLIINRSVTLRCGNQNLNINKADINNSCILSGGKQQVLIQGNKLDVILEGITFQKSKQSSIGISATESSVTFQRCLWRQHSGGDHLILLNTSVLPNDLKTKSRIKFDLQDTTPNAIVDSGDFNQNRSQSEYLKHWIAYTRNRKRRHSLIHRFLQEEKTTSVSMNQCHFQKNSLRDSLIINDGSILSIQNSNFDSNTCSGRSLIVSYKGKISLTSNTFSNSNNQNDEIPTRILALVDDSQISQKGNCVNDTMSTCTGIFTLDTNQKIDCDRPIGTNCKGKCLVFDNCYNSTMATTQPDTQVDKTLSPTPAAIRKHAKKCPTNPDRIGYIDMPSLLSDLQNGITSFRLCPSTELQGSLDVQLNKEKLSIECYDDNCVWTPTKTTTTTTTKGGRKVDTTKNKFHLRVEGTDYALFLSGIRFRHATDVSTILLWEGDTNSKNTIQLANFQFQNCTWEQNSGKLVIHMDGMKASSTSKKRNLLPYNDNPQQTIQVDNRHWLPMGRNLLEGKSELMNCNFYKNEVDNVILVNASSLVISNSTFQDNTVKRSIIVLDRSTIRMRELLFQDNILPLRQGIIYISDNFTISKTENVCTSSKYSKNKCSGILKKGGVCKQFPRCKPDCIDDWNFLLTEVDAANLKLTLCPNSTIDVPDESPLLLKTNNTVLQCGENGKRGDKCTVNGGTDQIVIQGSNISIFGVVFTGSSRISVIAEGTANMFASLQDCEFKNHRGISVLSIDRDTQTLFNPTEDGEIMISEIKASSVKSMQLTLTNCTLEENKVSLSPIFVRGGMLDIESTVFLSNEGDVGAIAVMAGSKLGLSNSCFIGNTGNSPNLKFASIVLVEKAVDLKWNDDNFGLGNVVANSDCSNGVKQGSSICIPFEARSCVESSLRTSSTFAEFSTCVYDIQSIRMQLEKFDKSIVIILCPFTIINFGSSKSMDPLVIVRSNVTIQCGSDGSRENQCLFLGGNSQIKMSGKVNNIIIRGITFTGAKSTSMSIQGSSPLSVEIIDCMWQKSFGDNAIFVKSSDPITVAPTGAPTRISTDDDVFVEEVPINKGRLLTSGGFQVLLSRCTFQENKLKTSVIFSVGGTLNVQSCYFKENQVASSVVSKESGYLIMTSSCFEEKTRLVSTDESYSLTKSNYASMQRNLSVSTCVGVYDTNNEVCEIFNTTSCQASVTENCFNDWYNLSQAIETARLIGKASVFTLCPSSLLKVDRFDPIHLDLDDTMLMCGLNGLLEDRCTVTGGNIQFVVSGNVKLIGINFLDSSVASIHATGDESKSLSIENCLFSAHSGLASVLSYFGDIRESRIGIQRQSKVTLLPESGMTMSLNISNSAFIKNQVAFAPLSSLGGDLDVYLTSFADNVGLSSAIGVWYGGKLQFKKLCSDETDSIPAVIADADSNVAGFENGFENDEKGNNECTGLQFGSKCLALPKETCQSVYEPPPSRGCYDDWFELGRAISSLPSQIGNEISLSICKSTFLNVDDDVDGTTTPMDFSDKNIKILCGKEGRRDDDCVIRGGKSHIMMRGSGRAHFVGLTFEGSNFSSVMATADSDFTATFTDCEWRNCSGKAAILIIHPLDPNTDLMTENFRDLADESGSGMSVLLDKCLLEDNNVDYGLLTNVGGSLNLLETIITNNRKSQYGIVVGIKNAKVGFSFSCFADNDSIERGIIFIDSTSTLSINRNTFAVHNEVQLDDTCNDIFMEKKGSCQNSSLCEGDCVTFQTNKCRLPAFKLNYTSEPKNMPSSSPSLFPSMIGNGDGASNSSKKMENTDSNSGPRPMIVAILALFSILFVLLLMFVFYRRRRGRTFQNVDTGKKDDEESLQLDFEENEGSRRSGSTQEMNENDQIDIENVDGVDPSYRDSTSSGIETHVDDIKKLEGGFDSDPDVSHGNDKALLQNESQ